MLVLDFINVGNGDSILVREMEQEEQKFAMLVDCGHDNLVRDDHEEPLDPRSMRIYAADFLRKHGVAHLDILLVTHFHRDHIGGLARVLEAVSVDKMITTYLPPLDLPPIDPDDDMTMPKAARNLLRYEEMYASALRKHGDRIGEIVVYPGREKMVSVHETTDGQRTYISAAFENAAFAVQTVTADDLPALSTLNMLRMPASTRMIEDEAFEGGAFQGVVIPDGCVSIGSKAFYKLR